jgi:hypothetical protein
MSLLLEALKKAEKAKEEAQRRAKASGAADVAADPEATVAAEPRHVTTRDQLPDISAPLEIVSDDLRRPEPPAKAPPRELSLAEDPPAAARPAREPKAAPRREPARAAASQSAAQNTERATAQRVFEAKFK